jgi:hypothetical protein
MSEEIEGLAFCACLDQDSLPGFAWLTDVYGKSVMVLICPACGGQIKTEKEE